MESRGETHKTRVYWLDYVRTLAICMVVLNHAAETVYDTSASALANTQWLSRLFFFTAFHIGRYGVPLFLCLTGYLVLSKSYTLTMAPGLSGQRSYGDFLKHKYLRLLLSIEIWIVIYHFFTGIFFAKPMGVKILLKKMLFLQKIGLLHEWYIYMILALYIILPFVAYLLQHMDKKCLFVPITMILTANFILPMMNNAFDLQKNGYYLQIDVAIIGGTYLLYTVFGYLLQQKLLAHVKTAVLLVLMLVGGVGGVLLQYTNYKLTWYTSLPLFISSIALFELCSRFPNTRLHGKAMAVTLSKLSFGIYLIHPIVLYVLERYFVFALPRPEQVLLYGALVLFISALCTYLLSKISKLGKWMLYL